jgi:hypothetical protein
LSEEQTYEEQELDPELMELAQGSSRDSVLRPILMLMVLVLGGFIINDWREELAYYFSPSEPVELGHITDFPERVSEDPTWRPDIPHNRYVSLTGIPIRRTLSNNYKYFKLIGGELYIEAPRDDAELSELERIERGDPQGDTDRSYFEGEGRALSFGAMPKRYATLRQYYSTNYNVTFCVDLDASSKRQLEAQRRDIATKMWATTYEEASAEEREARGMKSAPSQAELDELLEENPVCVDAWLLQSDKKPADHLWYVLLSAVFGLFMLVDLYFLGRWVLRAVSPQDDL